jgi:hypothetical protein
MSSLAASAKPSEPKKKAAGLRRFRIKKNEYESVLGWLRNQEHDEKEDEKSPEPLAQKGFTMPSDWMPKITWAHKTPMRIKKTAHGKHMIEVRENGVWKTLVHEQGIDGLLRDLLLSSSSDVPLSRDAGYHAVQKMTVGISRRAFGKFIAKQAVLQITRDRLPEQLRLGAQSLKGRGYLEMDLVEAKGRDIGKYVHHAVNDFYWITLVDRLTGWLEAESIPNKAVKTVAPKLEKMLKRMARVLKTDVKYIRSDKGSEFKADTQLVLEHLGIQHKFVKSGNRIEQANKTYQKTWYRIMRLGRGDLRNRNGVRKLDTQAQAIFNNTLSTVTGKTPLEALETPDRVLITALEATMKKRKVPKYKAAPIAKGDRVRYLIKAVVGKNKFALAYKSYRGKHWSAQVHTVAKISKHLVRGNAGEADADYNVKYYIGAGGGWHWRDELLKVPGVDRLSHDRVVQKHRERHKNYKDEIGDMALGDPEDQP